MIDNKFLLEDRLTKIKSTMDRYGEENFAMSWKGLAIRASQAREKGGRNEV